MTDDTTRCEPLPTPTPEEFDQAAKTLARLAEATPLDGWGVTFRPTIAGTLDLTGVWPPKQEPGDIREIVALIPEFLPDADQVDRDLAVLEAKAALEIRQAFERANLNRELMRDGLASVARVKREGLDA